MVKDKTNRYLLAEEQKRVAQQAEAQAKADEAARRERERLEKEAAKLKSPELKAERLEQAAAVVAPVIQVASVVEKQKGVSTVKRWKHKVTDIDLLPKMYMLANDKMLAGVATSSKGVAKIPGVQFYSEDGLAVGSK